MFRTPSLLEAIQEMAKYIYDQLGYGHTESVYQKAFEVLLFKRGYAFDAQRHLDIRFEGVSIGYCIPDLVIGFVVVELKTLQGITPACLSQIDKYLKIVGEDYDGIVVNFGPQRVDFSVRGDQL